MKLSIKDVSQSIISGISEKMSSHGFIFDKYHKYYIKRTEDSHQIFDLVFMRKDAGILVEPVVRIKIRPIEDIYHKVATKDEEYFEGTDTLGNNLGRIIDHFEKGAQQNTNSKMKYLIENEKDIAILKKVIPNKFEQYALRYFDNYSSVAKTDELLNSNPREISIHNWLYPLRACLALIAAKINHNPRYDELVNIYEQELENAADNYRKEFSLLKNILSNMND